MPIMATFDNYRRQSKLCTLWHIKNPKPAANHGLVDANSGDVQQLLSTKQAKVLFVITNIFG